MQPRGNKPAHGAVPSHLCAKLTPVALAMPLLMNGLAWAQTSESQAAQAPAGAASAPSADAASAAPSKSVLQEVIVTAERRGSTVQKTPISMTAVSGAVLQEKGITSAASVARETAGVSIRSGGGGQTEFVMRGMASTNGGVSATTGVYLDEVSVATPTTAAAGKIGIDPDLYDLARVEILRGPQGTLYGGGSMGGTLKLVPQEPEMNRFSGSAQVQGSRTASGGTNGSVSAALNVPLSKDVAALRVVATRRHNSGWLDRVVSPDMPVPDASVTGSYFDAPRGDVKASPASKVYKNVNDEDISQLRVSAVVKPTAGLTITPFVLYQESKYGGASSYDIVPGDQAHYQPYDVSEPFKFSVTLASVKVNYELENTTVTSVTSVSKQRLAQVQDTSEVGFQAVADVLGISSWKPALGGLGPIGIVERNPTEQVTQELRLASKGAGPLQWIVGGYLGRFKSTYLAQATAPEAVPAIGTDIFYGGSLGGSRRQVALFGNASYQLTPELKVTAGARGFRISDKFEGYDFGLFGSGRPAETSSGSSKGVNPMLNLSYAVAQDSLVYSTVSKGFREGSSQRGVPSVCAADLAALGRTEAPLHYEPDTVWNYEVGSKNRFFNKQVTFNASVYQLDWEKVQKGIYLPTCGFAYTDNAGSAKIRGVELEMGARIVDGLEFEQSIGYTHARYSSDNVASNTKKGDLIEGVPTWNAASSLRFYKQVSEDYSFIGRLSAVYVGKFVDHSSTKADFGNYTLVNLRLGLEADTWSVALYANNLTNKFARLGFQKTLSLASNATERAVMERPRTIGLEFNYNW